MRLHTGPALTAVSVCAIERAVDTSTLAKAAEASGACVAVGFLLHDARLDTSCIPPALPATCIDIAYESLLTLGGPHCSVTVVARSVSC